MYAYDEDYLYGAKEHFAGMIDYAVKWCGMPLREFYSRFLNSGIPEAMQTGHPKYLAGMSGIELAIAVVNDTGGNLPVDPSYTYPWEDPSYYWTGGVLCHYQWYKGASFSAIDKGGLPIEKIHSLFNPFHEADITKFIDVADSLYRPASIRERRKRFGYTQEQLAEKSGVTLRMIRAYEQGTQDIARAEAATVIRLAKELCCTPDCLIKA